MKVEKVTDDDAPFITITLTKKEATILKALIRYNIEDYTDRCGRNILNIQGANEYFATPLYNKLSTLGVKHGN